MSYISKIETDMMEIEEEDLSDVVENLTNGGLFFYVLPLPDGIYEVGVRKCDMAQLRIAMGLPRL